jgi:toxin ParE1/3/4
MIGRYSVLPAADKDLDDCAGYLSTHAGLGNALRFYDAARSTFGKLADTPGIGERWPTTHHLLAGLRVSRIEGFEKYLVFYHPVDDGIEIVRVIHAARDLGSVLES